ncbi:MAG: oligosaccharide flippase family protein [Thermodesulfovibrionales bacterium]|nr:oligosaccharide flippase family protein [Thermodesulfovibrionales bacterium]
MKLNLKIPATFQSGINIPILRATFESVVTGIAGQAVLIISGILVARALGLERRGYLALLMVFPAILSQLGTLGLPQAATYFIAKDNKRAAEVYNPLKIAFFGQALVLVMIHIMIVTLYVHHEPKEVALAGYLTLAVIPGVLVQQYGLAILQGCRTYRLFNVMRLMPATLYAAGVLLIFLIQVASLPTIAVTWVGVNIMVGFLTLKFSLTKAQGLREESAAINSSSFSQMLKFGLKGLLGTASPLQNFRLDQLIAGLFISPVALGIYVVGQAFTNLVRFIAQSVGMVAYPSVAAEGNTGTGKRLIWRFFVGVSILNGIVVLILIALMPILVPFFFGKEFSESIPIARLLLLSAYFESLRQILVEGMRGLGRPEVSTWAEIAMYPFLFVFVPVLISTYNLIGLAGAVVLGYFLSLIVAGVLFKVIS